MFSIRSAILLIVVASVWVRASAFEPFPPPDAAVAESALPSGAGAFDDARMVPGDVSFYLHVADAARLRRQIAQQPIAELIQSLIGDDELRAAWMELAQRSQLRDAELFDTLLGRRFTIAARAVAVGAGPRQWAIITDVAPETMTTLRRAWRVRVQLPRNGFAVALLPEQDILLAERGRTVIIGPRGDAALFDTIVAGSLQDENAPLSQRDGFAARAAAVGNGSCGLYISHGKSIGGWSLLTADLNGRSIKIRQAARFERPPFERQITKLACDYSVVRNFERDQLATVIEPGDLGPTRLESFTYELLGDGIGARELQNAAGNRRILTFGEEEGRLRRVPDDVLAPSPAVIIEVDGDKYTIDQLDVRMTRLASAMNDVRDGAMLVNVPPPHVYKHGHDRRIDVSSAVDAFTGGFPIMKDVTLNWDVVRGDGGAWCVIAGSPRQLESVAKSLRAPCQSEPQLVGTFDSVGSINGVRLSQHLLSWKAVAGQLAPANAREQFGEAIELLSQLTGGADRICWQMRRPARDEMILDMQIKLRESSSAGNEPLRGDD